MMCGGLISIVGPGPVGYVQGLPEFQGKVRRVFHGFRKKRLIGFYCTVCQRSPFRLFIRIQQRSPNPKPGPGTPVGEAHKMVDGLHWNPLPWTRENETIARFGFSARAAAAHERFGASICFKVLAMFWEH